MFLGYLLTAEGARLSVEQSWKRRHQSMHSIVGSTRSWITRYSPKQAHSARLVGQHGVLQLFLPDEGQFVPNTWQH